MYQVWDGDLYLFNCDEIEVDEYLDQGFSVVKDFDF